MTYYNSTLTLYSLEITGLSLELNAGGSIPMLEALKNGRANYIIFEELVRKLTGLVKTSGSDHEDSQGSKYEQKSYVDYAIDSSKEFFQTSSSSTFPANRYGKEIKELLEGGNYEKAKKLCECTGYSKNNFYIYTNTGQYDPSVPFKYIIVPRELVLKHLSKSDPRLISRSEVLALAKIEVKISRV